MASDMKKFLAWVGRNSRLSGQVAHVEEIPPRPADLRPLDLAPRLAQALHGQGVRQLYSHQAQALYLARAGRDLVVATPTASGKSLVYALPVLEGLLADPAAKALFIFPLKALEQDQMQALNGLALAAGLPPPAAIYDGDTPTSLRKRLRDQPPPVLITNPDMLHLGICAFPGAWEALLANLRTIVIDEVHTYRGVFGSHVAQVLRRLLRLCQARGSRPRFVLCSATIANPGEHAAALTGRAFAPEQVIEDCGAPAAGRYFIMMNPQGAASTTAAHLLTAAVERGLSTICFTRSRLHTELIHSWVGRQRPELAAQIAGYRAGFLPEERRQIERQLSSGRLRGVVTTSALEMGIDIGGLDVCILVGYPGSQINTWQRGGRVGRAGQESAIFLVAQPDALDQYFLKHPREFFERPLEAAVLDPDNPHIVGPHLVCAAAEEPLVPGEGFFDLERHAATVADLETRGELLRDVLGEKLFAARKSPHRLVDLRGAGQSFAIVEPEGKVVGSLDGVRVYKEGYPGAIYLHRTQTYEVRGLDWVMRRVTVTPRRADFYTRARSDKETEILEETGRRPVANFLLHQGRLKVTEVVTGFERRRLSGGDLLGVFGLDMPPLTFETHGLWLDIEDGLRRLIEGRGLHFMGSIHALEHAAIGMFPLFALCDRGDIGGISIPLHPQTKKAAVFIYDGVPGGVGLAERAFEVIEGLLAKVEELLAECPCEDGCPACVHSPKCGNGNKPLDKAGALLLTRALLGKEEMDLPAGEIPLPPPPHRPKRREPRPEEPLRYGVLDLETQRLAQEVGGWQNVHLMRVSVAVLYDQASDRYEAFEERDMPRLIARLQELELVVGFNIKRFDYTVLSAYTQHDLLRLPTLDILEDVHSHLNYRLSLQSLASATLGAEKSADGLQAVAWWRAGDMDKLTRYCQQDVELTLGLARFGQEHGHLLFDRKDQGRLRVPVDWSWPALRKRFGQGRGK
ncbi:MAG: DEAD/DEAH box helicase [Desulfarculus sp.]|nr:DEAD/DEAH box helicase [Desulfarculus sp.]